MGFICTNIEISEIGHQCSVLLKRSRSGEMVHQAMNGVPLAPELEVDVTELKEG